MAKKRIDIHDYEGRVQRERELLSNCDLSQRDKDAILEYCRALFLAGVSKPRMQKEMATLRLFAGWLKNDLKDATITDLKRAMEHIQGNAEYSVWTKSDYAKIVKKFYHWLEHGDAWRISKDVPARVAWIHGHVKKKDQPRLQRADMLTEEEAHNLIDEADSARDKALLAVLWDTGARIGEIGSLMVGSVSFTDAGTFIDMRGKTGQRTPFVIECTPHLVRWLGLHPARDNPQAPLWIASQNGRYFPDQAMTYNGLVLALGRAFARTKIKKGFNPHLFRHSRATWCAINGWTHLEMCKFFGWASDSTMPAYYTSLVNEDVESRMRKCYGLENKQDKQLELRRPFTCRRCQAVNEARQRFCFRCGMALTIQVAYEVAETEKQQTELLNKLAKEHPKVLHDIITAVAKLGALERRDNAST